MDKLMRYTILAVIGGVILAFNMYHADYKLLVAQIGTIALVAIFVIARLTKSAEAIFEIASLPSVARNDRGKNLLAMTARNPAIWFLAVCVLSFILSPHKLASGQELYKTATWIVFGIMVSAISHQPSAEKLKNDIINIWLVCALIIGVYGIMQFFGIDFMKFKLPHHRIVSNFGNPTLLAGFLAMTLPVAFVKAFDRKKTLIYRILIAIAIAVIFTNILLTRTRSGAIVAIIGLFILALVSKKIELNKIMLLTAGILAVIFILSLVPSTRDAIFNTILRKTARFDIWENTFQLIRVNPLLGTGIGTFGLYFPNFVTEPILKVHFVGVEFVNHAHSEYLEILSEMGVVGLTAFLSAAGIAIYRFKKARNNGEPILAGLFAAFIAILVNNIVSVDMRYTSTAMFFWMITGILGNYNVIARAKPEAISEIASLPSVARNDRGVRRSLITTATIIIIAAGFAIYFTVKPYMEIQKVNERKFFAEDTGQIYTKIKNMETADRKDADYLFRMAVLYAKNKDFKNAKGYFIKAIKKDPGHAGAFNNLGNIALLEEYPGSVGRARDLYLNALKAEPKNADYLVSLAYSYFMLNEMEGAMKAVERALSIEPDNSRALLLRRQMMQ